MTYRVTAWAAEQIALLLTYSEETYGRVHRHNYQLLLMAAMEALSADPNRSGTSRITGYEGLGVYELRLA